MFIDDIKNLRRCYLTDIDECLKTLDDQQYKFTEERQFFLKSIDEKDKEIAKLRNQIGSFEQQLQDE